MAKKNDLRNQVIAGIIIALFAGSSAPWWWGEAKEIFMPRQQPVPTATPMNIRVEVVLPSQPTPNIQQETPVPVIVSPASSSRHTVQEQPQASQPAAEPSYDVAVLIVNDGKSIDWDLSQQIVSMFASTGQRVGTPFSDAIVSGRSFDKLLGCDTREARKIGLSGYCQHAILGKKVVTFTNNPGLQDMKTADVALSIRMLSCKTGTVEESFTLTTNGPGFSNSKAEEVAIERMVQEFEQKKSQLTQHL